MARGAMIGGPMAPEITDIWFRSKLPLVEIAQRLGLAEIYEDAENYWEWVIGTCGDVQVDITRTHTRPAGRVDTRIFLLEGAHFSESLLNELVRRLREFIPGPIACGRWVYRSGDDDFNRIVVRTYGPDTV